MIEQPLCYCKLDLLRGEAINGKPIHFNYCNFFSMLRSGLLSSVLGQSSFSRAHK